MIPFCIALESICDLEHGRLVEGLADSLQAYRHRIRRRTAWTEAAGRPEILKGAQNRADTANTDSSRWPIRDTDCPTFTVVEG